LGFFLHAQVDFNLTYLANVVFFSALLALAVYPALDYDKPERRSVRSIFTAQGFLANVSFFFILLGTLVLIFSGYLLSREKRFLELARSRSDKGALKKALEFMPLNVETRIDLVLADLEAQSPDFDSIVSDLNLAKRQNPYESQAYFLLSQVPVGRLEERIALAEKAIQLDPYNRPYYYLGLSRLYREIGDEERELDLLLTFDNRFRITERITPDFPRPNWVNYNITFQKIYSRLSELVYKKSPVLSLTYRRVAEKFAQ